MFAFTLFHHPHLAVINLSLQHLCLDSLEVITKREISTMSTSFPFAAIQQYLTNYGITTYTIFGGIGLLINISMYSQATYRRSPFSLYILFMSWSALIGLCVAYIPIIYTLNQTSSIINTLLYCRLQFYFRHSFSQMMRSFFILACADRYAMTSRRRVVRLFSQYRIAVRVIPFVIIFWLLLAIFPTMLREIINGRCDSKAGLATTLAGLYVLFTLCIIPSVSMVIFGILLVLNLKQRHARVQPITNVDLTMNRFRKRDRDIIRILLIEIIAYTITATPITAFYLYRTVAQQLVKTTEQQQWAAFFNYICTTFLLNCNNSLSFWIYLSWSKSYRIELKKSMIKLYKYLKR